VHHGPPKVKQKHKILRDAFKLLHAAAALPIAPRLVLCLCDPQAAAARSWAAQALRAFAIEVAVVELPAELQVAVRAVQQRQCRRTSRYLI
jgi:hypothetical protein